MLGEQGLAGEGQRAGPSQGPEESSGYGWVKRPDQHSPSGSVPFPLQASVFPSGHWELSGGPLRASACRFLSEALRKGRMVL